MLTSSDLKAIKQLLNDGLDPINKEVVKTNKKLVEHDKRFEGIDRKLVEHDRRFEEIGKKLVDHDKRFGGIDKKLVEHDKRFDKLQDNLDLTIRFFDRDYIRLRRDYDNHTLKFHTVL